MSIMEQISRDMTEAMKAKEADRLSALRMVKSALQVRETEVTPPLEDKEAVKVLSILLNQRRDSAQQFRAAGRVDRAEKEESEALIIQSYLPEAASLDEMSAAVSSAITETGAATPKDMGKVMKAVQAKLEGKTVDGKALSELVKARLSA